MSPIDPADLTKHDESGLARGTRRRPRARRATYTQQVTLRQLYYRLVSTGTIPNSPAAYKHLSAKTAAARRAGQFPDLVDRGREITRPLAFANTEQARNWLADTYRRDRSDVSGSSLECSLACSPADRFTTATAPVSTWPRGDRRPPIGPGDRVNCQLDELRCGSEAFPTVLVWPLTGFRLLADLPVSTNGIVSLVATLCSVVRYDSCMGKYAGSTDVAPDRSRNEIERTLQRYGARQFAYGWDERSAMLAFVANGRQVRFVLPLPDRDAPEFTRTPTGRERSASAAAEAYEQAVRQRWRALALVIKAKLEAVDTGIVDFTSEFLAHLVLPGGETVGEAVVPRVDEAYRTGKPPELLPAFTPRALPR